MRHWRIARNSGRERAMPQTAKPSQLSSASELGKVWDAFCEGRVVACARDAGSMALSVDAAAGVYRFVCTSCGYASPWFESTEDGVRTRNAFPEATAPLSED